MATYDADVEIKIGVDTSPAETAISKLQKSMDKAYKSPSASMRSMGVQADKLVQRIEQVTEKMRTLGATKIKSADYVEQEKQLQRYVDKAQRVQEAIDAMNANNTKHTSRRYQEAEARLATYKAKIDEVTASLKKMREDGTAYSGTGKDTQRYADLARYLNQLNIQSDILNQRIKEADNGAKTLKRSLQSLAQTAARPFKLMGNAIKNQIIKHNNEATHSFKNLFKQVLKYGLGIRSLFLLYKKLRQYGKEAFKDMATQYPEINAQLSDLISTFSQMTHSIATAFQPLLSVVLPILNAIMNAAIAAANAIGSFFAALTGQGFIYKAVKQQKSLAGAIGGTGGAAKEAKEELAEYDKLLVISQDNSGGGGGGGGGGDAGTTWFEKSPLMESAVNLADMIKKAWNESDFKPLGEAFGKKITEALNNIPWDEIRKTALKIGTSIAQFLNGAISPDLFSALGMTIANALNTALDVAYGFVTTFDWKNFGNSLASGVNRFFQTFEFTELGKTIHDLIGGALDAATTFFTNADFTLIGEKIAEFIATLDIPDLAHKLYTLAKAVISALGDAIQSLWENGDATTKLGMAIIQVIAAAKILSFGNKLLGLGKDIMNLIVANLPKTIKIAGLGLIVAGVYLAETDLGDGVVDDLLLDALGATAVFGGLRMLGVPMGLSLKIASIKFAWDIGTDIGTALGEWISEQLGDLEGAKYYKEFSWSNFIIDVLDAADTGNLKKGLKMWWTQETDNMFQPLFELLDPNGAYLGEALKGLKNLGSTIWNNIIEGWNNFDKANTDFWTPLIELFNPENLSELWSKIKGVGKDLWDGLWKGFWGVVTDVGSWISTQFNNYIIKPIKDFFGIHSPSKLMEEIGGFVMQGFLNGLVKIFETIKTWITGAVQWIIDKFNTAIDKIKEFIGIKEEVEYKELQQTDLSKGGKATKTTQTVQTTTTETVQGPTINTNASLAEIQKVQTALQQVGRLASTTTAQIDNSFRGLASRVSSYTTSFANSFRNAFRSSSQLAHNAVQSIVKGFSSLPTSLSSVFRQAYTQSIQQFAGISTWASSIYSMIANSQLKNVPALFVMIFRQAVEQSRIQVMNFASWFKSLNFDKTATLSINTPSVAKIQGIWSAIAGVWRDKTATFSIKVNSNVDDFKNLLNTTVIAKLNRTFAGNPIFKDVRIPYLAQGAVLPPNKPFMAMLGDQKNGTNIETPLDTMIEAFTIALDSRGSSNNEPIVLQLDGRTVAQCVWDEEEKRYKQTGTRYRYT